MELMNEGRINLSEGIIEIEAGELTDFFTDELHGYNKGNAPFYYREISGDFVFRAKVVPEFSAVYDAGALMVIDNESKWFKLAFENTDLGHTSIVSVVTDLTSDDCNGEIVNSAEPVWLQIFRRGDHWACHYSLNGQEWKMTRYFKLKMNETVKAGFESQSPAGKGSKTKFSDVFFENITPKDMRKGDYVNESAPLLGGNL